MAATAAITIVTFAIMGHSPEKDYRGPIREIHPFGHLLHRGVIVQHPRR
ncbi:MAG TPA: hypothetical protein PKA06_00555 [Gemmatales bacterium]|nr:hypothetical protein [Gemmatales bacterium]